MPFPTHNCDRGIPGYYSKHCGLEGMCEATQISAHNEYQGLRIESVTTEQSAEEEEGFRSGFLGVKISQGTLGGLR